MKADKHAALEKLQEVEKYHLKLLMNYYKKSNGNQLLKHV
jgi:hypothetical protein